jgi:hypothetical protein
MLIAHDFDWDDDADHTPATLIPHDFDWNDDADRALRSAASAPPSTPASLPPVTTDPDAAIIILEHQPAFSRLTLALAIVALVLAAALKLA